MDLVKVEYPDLLSKIPNNVSCSYSLWFHKAYILGNAWVLL